MPTAVSQSMAITAFMSLLLFQGWLGAKDTMIHAGEGPVTIIRWAGTLVAWANNLCVRVRSPALHPGYRSDSSFPVHRARWSLVSCTCRSADAVSVNTNGATAGLRHHSPH